MAKDVLGLTSNEVHASRLQHGDNSLTREKTKGFFKRFFENLNDPIIKILILALVVELIFTFGNCNLFEVFGIVIAILIATTVSTVSEYGSEKAFLKMQAQSTDVLLNVLRDGKICDVAVSDIVVGDIVYLFAGEQIAADGVIVSGKIKVDQSALNGESRDVTKKAGRAGKELSLDDTSRVYRGSVVVSGEGMMRVERVGAKTYYGMIAKEVQTETRQSPLKLRLSAFAAQISKIGYVMAFIVALTYIFNTVVADNGFILSRILESIKNPSFLFSTLTHALTLMITVIVVAAPEGLPMMITVVLSANMKKMVRDKVLVKKLVGIETAGSMNLLFTDKTGTLTVGNLECERFISAFGSFKSVNGLKKHKALYEYMVLNAMYNTDAAFKDGKIIGGNSTDRAVLNAFKDESVKRYSVKEKEPFSSERKISSVKLENGLILIKGAPEIILSQSDMALSKDGSAVKIDKRMLESEYKNAANQGGRVIAVAYRDTEKNFVFVAFVVLRDKVRPGVKNSVLGVIGAGVQVVMLTGDGKETATAIAKECGILFSEREQVVLSSSELALLSDEELKEILPRLAVVARALPQDKTRLVRVSQQLDLVVGMTGDGINDAPALKLADIGFAMGSGTDIAKGAGDVIILDNSFFAINRTILYGRTIFKSIRKFITFQLIMNLVACGVSLVGQFLGIDSPITIIQMLWVNIIMDTLGGLAFAGEPPLEIYMKEKPKRRAEPILSREMIGHILITGAYTLSLCILFLQHPHFRLHFRYGDGDIYLMTAFYALFIFLGIFNCFGARSERMHMFSNITKNKPFGIIMLLISVIQILMIYYGGTVFRTSPLLLSEISYVLLLAFSVIPFEFIRRVFTKLSKK